MPEKSIEELAADVRDERERMLAVLKLHQAELENAWLYHRLWNMIYNGIDPRDTDYMDDRLMP